MESRGRRLGTQLLKQLGEYTRNSSKRSFCFISVICVELCIITFTMKVWHGQTDWHTWVTQNQEAGDVTLHSW